MNCVAAPDVTPLAGVWIEIVKVARFTGSRKSLPSRECGLKYTRFHPDYGGVYVTPLAGVWIEIPISEANR